MSGWRDTLSDALNNVTSAASDAWDNMKSAASNAWDNASSAASNAWDNASSAVSNAYGNVCSYASNASDYISSKVGQLKNNYNDIMSSLKGIGTSSGGISKYISNSIGSISNDMNAIQKAIDLANGWKQRMEDAEKKSASLVQSIKIPSFGATITGIVSSGEKALQGIKDNANNSINSALQSIINKLNPKKDGEVNGQLGQTNTNTIFRADGTIIGTGIRTARDSTKIYNEKGEVIGTLNADERFTILEETSDGKFKVQMGDKDVYISQNDVLINAKDYIPSLEVDLLMAHGAVFKVLGQAITNLTGVKFYNNAGSEDGSEVWMNYEMAQKANIGQQQFLQDGKTMVIYDAYRPKTVSQKMYKAFSSFLDNHPEIKGSAFGDWGISWFLAQGVSAHNYGMAVDIGLKDTATGETLAMPSDIHTLDISSVLNLSKWKKSNVEAEKNALYMHDVMTDPNGANCTDLASEWWHFQLEKSKYLKDVNNKIPYETAIDIPN